MMGDYRVKANINWLKRKRSALLKKLAACGPFVDGSVVKVRRRCGNKNCRCARGEKHESLYLMYKVKGVTSGVYIPVDLEEEVKEWSREYKRVKRIIREISRAQKSIIRRHVKEKRLKKGRK
jgi:hypothetical protein